MRLRTAALLVMGTFVVCAWPSARGDAPKRALPPLPADDDSLPPLPDKSARNANYTIEARLDPEKHTIEGSLVLEWRNTSEQPLSTFPFHLYWNAFRNNLSTSARGAGRRAARFLSEPDPDRDYGYTDVRSIRLLGEKEEDLTPSLRFVQPDDHNQDDRTVVEVRTTRPVPAGRL